MWGEYVCYNNNSVPKIFKVKSGAENLAKVYGAGLADKKLMAEVFTKLMDSNAKLNILRVAMQKYKGRLGEPVGPESDKHGKENLLSFSRFLIFSLSSSLLCPSL